MIAEENIAVDHALCLVEGYGLAPAIHSVLRMEKKFFAMALS